MKKLYLVLLVVACAFLLGGCQSTKSTSDEAEDAIIPEGLTQEAVNTPPVPPEPTRPTS